MRKNAKKILSMVWITLGALMASFSVAALLLPNDAIDYGTAGIAIIISKLTGFNLSICVACVVTPFLILGFIRMGLDFIVRAGWGSLVYTLGLSWFEEIHIELITEHFIAVAFGGAILGAGLSLILRYGGCIDGSEILANVGVDYLNKKKGKNYSMTGFLIGFNAIVYTLAFVFIDKNSALLSLLVYIVATAVIDHFTDHFEAIKQVTIITKDPEEMIERIRKDLNKTCTTMDSQGAIAGNNKTLICYVTYFELQHLREIISEYKNRAFITVSTIDEIIK
jgi:uncharacterized membrane-anchored protein YitT (DUF2179 family)